MFMQIKKIIVLLMLIYVGYFFYSWKSSIEEIKLVCGEIQKGQKMQEVKNIIESSRYLRHKDSSDTESNKKSIIIVSNANMGRYTCDVEHDGEVVIKSDLTYLD
jgi:hypothetical protein